MENKSNNEIGRNSSRLADEIFAKLNQGSLFEIHQILDNMEDDQQKKSVIEVFTEKFNFNFLRYI